MYPSLLTRAERLRTCNGGDEVVHLDLHVVGQLSGRQQGPALTIHNRVFPLRKY